MKEENMIYNQNEFGQQNNQSQSRLCKIVLKQLFLTTKCYCYFLKYKNTHQTSWPQFNGSDGSVTDCKVDEIKVVKINLAFAEATFEVW